MPDLNAHRCCFCTDLLAEGDRIACADHRVQIEATPTLWDECAAATARPDDGGAG